MQNENETIARGVNPVFGHLDEAGFFANPTVTTVKDVQDAADTIEQASALDGQLQDTIAAGEAAAAQDPAIAAMIAEREAKFFKGTEIAEVDFQIEPTNAPALVLNMGTGLVEQTEGEAPVEEGKTYAQKIGETGYLVLTEENGYKKIVLPRGVNAKIDAVVISTLTAAQEYLNELNVAAGFEAVPPEQIMMALSAQAMRQRQLTQSIAPNFGHNHPFAVAARIKAKGVNPNSRAFRQLVKKELGAKRFSKK